MTALTLALILMAVFILVGFSLAMLATLSRLIDFDNSTPRYKRTPR